MRKQSDKHKDILEDFSGLYKNFSAMDSREAV